MNLSMAGWQKEHTYLVYLAYIKQVTTNTHGGSLHVAFNVRKYKILQISPAIFVVKSSW